MQLLPRELDGENGRTVLTWIGASCGGHSSRLSPESPRRGSRKDAWYAPRGAGAVARKTREHPDRHRLGAPV